MRRKYTDSGVGGVQMGLIITPMLDMAFQLMAFFIMTYHPSALEGHIDGNLLPPTLIATKGPKAADTPPDLPAIDAPPELQDVLMVIVKSVAKGQTEGTRVDGEPSRVMLKRPEAPSAVTVSDTDTTLDEGLKKLTSELKKILKEPGATKANIKIEADGNLKHMYLMRVYDACKIAGYQNISFVAPPKNPVGGN
ncbi:MAG: biopolymer transporter ExbD [Gemmataceae bacterium]|nr:biopolymer transporter ExbD [Gemmataceae bacterium]MCI0738783.1 biopolymer transporter ExbD [Gemmataceae bacterium]